MCELEEVRIDGNWGELVSSGLSTRGSVYEQDRAIKEFGVNV